MQDLDQLYRSSLANQGYTGHRPDLWDEQTGVQITIGASAVESKTADIYKKDGMNELNDLREQLLAHLLCSKVEVHFTKTDGTPATMLCTLNKSYIPEFERPKLKAAQTQIPMSLGQLLLEQDPLATINRGTTPQKPEDLNLIKIWAVDRSGWRSFRLERVTRILVHQD
jgi:hypothetical protein